MRNRGDRDILLPDERDPWRILRDLRSLIRWPRSCQTLSPQGLEPEDLCLAFEYLVAECQATGRLLEGLAEPLAVRMALLMGQARFAVQCRLAETLADQASPRFFLALYLATRVPVPQGRGLLLRMLTQSGLARWFFPAGSHAFDLRPAAVAALGQLRDPSLLGLFHRLLEKLSGASPNDPIVAAVQWSLMNLAPGGQGEPVPVSILNGRAGAGRSDVTVPQEPVPGVPGQQSSGTSFSGNGRSPTSAQSATRERDDLLAGF